MTTDSETVEKEDHMTTSDAIRKMIYLQTPLTCNDVKNSLKIHQLNHVTQSPINVDTHSSSFKNWIRKKYVNLLDCNHNIANKAKALEIANNMAGNIISTEIR